MLKTNDKRIELQKWRFMIDQNEYGLKAGWHTAAYDHSCWTEVDSYTSWETYDLALRDYESFGWFYTTYRASADRSLRHTLHFDGVGGVAKVWFNGQLVGETNSRYLPFEIDVSDYVNPGEENSVAVLVNNTFQGEEHLPGGSRVEWVLYGGLTHHVYMIEHPECYISHLYAKADMFGRCLVRATVRNEGKTDVSGQLSICTDTLPECSKAAPFSCPAGEQTEVEFMTEGKNVKLWSPEHPNLYTIHAKLAADGKSVHQVSDRIGYRTIEVRGTEILLNGEFLAIKGANRYDEYAPYGICPPKELIRDDLLEMKRCGCNLVRTHYPQDPVHYELADELGLIYMIEVVINWWHPTPEQTLADFETLKNEAIDCLDRTHYWFANHACWLIWSTSNECYHSEPAAQEMFRMLAERMRSYQTGHLITNVLSKPILDGKELDFCDFIAINNYSGSNKDDINEVENISNPYLAKRLEESRCFYPDKPIVITEYGIVSIRGLHNHAWQGRFTEEWAATYLKNMVRIFSQCPTVRGIVLWAWADYRHRREFAIKRWDSMHLHGPNGPYGVKTITRETKTAVFDALLELHERFDGKNPIE